MKKSFAQIIDLENKQFEKKIETKLPFWSGKNILVPSRLALEQCSSSQTAEYKALIASRLLNDSHHCNQKSLQDTKFRVNLSDLTGGLGVDSFAFAKYATTVHYFERNAELVEAVKANAKALNVNNIDFHCEEITPDSNIPDCDIIYADPARRNESGKKVFLLEDCSPDILTLLPVLFKKSRYVMLKLSPMADITMLSNRLGNQLKEIHIVSLNSEVKELLCILDREYNGSYTTIISDSGDNCLCFTPEYEICAKAAYADNIEVGQILIEPCPALMKTGYYKSISERFSIQKIATNTHLYISNQMINNIFLKEFRILQIFNFKQIKEIRKAYPSAEVSAKNIHLRSEELRSRLGIKSGGSIHIFGTTTNSNSSVLIVTEKL